jgi:sugar phosphate isomerase/epimerase
VEPQIEIGFSNNIYDNPADVVGSARTIAENFPVVEIELAEEAQPAVLEAAPADYDRLVNGLNELASEKSLSYSVHAAWYGPQTDLTAADDEERLASVALLKRSIQFAADIGAGVVTCHPGYHHGQGRRQLLDKLVDSVCRVESMISGAGVTLCVENMGAHRPAQVVLDSEGQALVCERSGASICLDIVHLATVFPDEQEMLLAIRGVAPLVKHVHLADTVRPAHRHIPIGRGDLPLEAILSQLKEAGYSGHAVVEEFNRGWSPTEYLSGALEFRGRARAIELAR